MRRMVLVFAVAKQWERLSPGEGRILESHMEVLYTENEQERVGGHNGEKRQAA